jgi:hypothetical protein
MIPEVGQPSLYGFFVLDCDRLLRGVAEGPMKTFLFLLVVALVGGAYVAGYLPEHRRLVESQLELGAAEAQFAEAEARLRLYVLRSRLDRVIESVRARNYGDAAKFSTEFFDDMRAAASQTQDARIVSELEAVLAIRDSVTMRLAVGDPAILDTLNGAMNRLRQLSDPLPAPGGAATNPPATPPAN